VSVVHPMQLDKKSANALGSRLIVDGREYSELDEIAASYIIPMNDLIQVRAWALLEESTKAVVIR
jgi:CheY-specific phosphatase CheX